MKRTSVFLISILSIAITFSFLLSCANSYSDDITSQEADISKSELILKLQEFNKTLPNDAITRGGLSKAQWAQVFLSDAHGAYRGALLGGLIGSVFGPECTGPGMLIGGVAVGGAASYVKYHKLTNNQVKKNIFGEVNTIIASKAFEVSYGENRENIISTDYSTGLSLGLDSCYSKIGILHNMVLNNVDSVDLNTIENLYNANLTSLEKEITSSEEFLEGFNKIVENPSNYNFNYSNKADWVMSEFFNALSLNFYSKSQVRRIVSTYTTSVKESSELTDSEKDALLSGFAVATYSYDYWDSQNTPPYLP